MNDPPENLRPLASLSYAELAARHVEGRDYRIEVVARPSARVAVIAPHGDGIERGTSGIARAIAGEDHHLYLFEGLLPAGGFEALHLTSHRFDEPRCLALLADCDQVVAVHGCNAEPDPGVLLGGRDAALKHAIARALSAVGIAVQTEGHRYAAQHPMNVCNRGRRGAGVQLEFTGRLRGGPMEAAATAAVRTALTFAHVSP